MNISSDAVSNPALMLEQRSLPVRPSKEIYSVLCELMRRNPRRSK
jgi:hypothetical protein